MAEMAEDKHYILELRHITKTFPGVRALDDVHFTLKKGEIHALMGENGAGKSTFIKIITGVHAPDRGDFLIDGKPANVRGPLDAQAQGISAIYQHVTCFPDITVAENIFMGHEKIKSPFKRIDWKTMNREAGELLAQLDAKFDARAIMGTLSVAQQQIVGIAKALSTNARILIMDEPTAPLSNRESEDLYRITENLKQKGVSVIFISHRFEDMYRLADRVTVLRDGKYINTWDIGDVDNHTLVTAMVGREIVQFFPKRNNPIGDVVFEVRDWTVYNPDDPERKKLDKVNISVRAGEVIGLAGLVGAGRTELATSIFGKYYGVNISGKTFIDGKEFDFDTIPKAIDHGVAYVTEDRKEFGLVLIETIKENTTMSKLKKIAKNSVVNEHEEIMAAEEYRRKLNIKTPSILQMAGNLSGGNQQKVVLAKWLFSAPRILILDEPTRGIDVGAKHEIYTIINDLAAQGMACILISSEMPEIIGMSDRIYVMSEGRITAELPGKTATQEDIMRHILSN